MVIWKHTREMEGRRETEETHHTFRETQHEGNSTYTNQRYRWRHWKCPKHATAHSSSTWLLEKCPTTWPPRPLPSIIFHKMLENEDHIHTACHYSSSRRHQVCRSQKWENNATVLVGEGHVNAPTCLSNENAFQQCNNLQPVGKRGVLLQTHIQAWRNATKTKSILGMAHTLVGYTR